MLKPFYHYLSALMFVLLGVYFYYNSTVPAIAIIFVALTVFQIFLARAVIKLRSQLEQEFQEGNNNNN